MAGRSKCVNQYKSLRGEIAMCSRVGPMGSIKWMTVRDRITRTGARTPGAEDYPTPWQRTVAGLSRRRRDY